jgi:hypothetical protein
MKRIAQAALVTVLACGAQAVFAQQSDQQIPQTNAGMEAAVVAQAGPGSTERQPVARGEAQPRRALSTLEATGLAGDGPFPSKGGAHDD